LVLSREGNDIIADLAPRNPQRDLFHVIFEVPGALLGANSMTGMVGKRISP
jgi:hypothetical protein